MTPDEYELLTAQPGDLIEHHGVSQVFYFLVIERIPTKDPFIDYVCFDFSDGKIRSVAFSLGKHAKWTKIHRAP